MAGDVTVPAGSPGPQADPDEGQEGTEAEAEPEEVSEATLPLDQVFEILRNQRRRHVLRILRDADEPVLIGELAEQIAAWENGKEPHEITSSERKRVYVGLYQAHLPKMDGMDVISFNKPRGVIEPAENIDAFDDYLAVDDPDRTRPWPLYYAGLSAASVVLLVIAFAATSVTSFPVVEVVLLLVVVSFSACTASIFWWRRRADSSSSS